MCKNCVKCGEHLDQTRSDQGICETCEAREAAHDQAYADYLDMAYTDYLDDQAYADYLDAQARADDVAFERAMLDDEPCECVHDMPGHHRCCPHYRPAVKTPTPQ